MCKGIFKAVKVRQQGEAFSTGHTVCKTQRSRRECGKQKAVKRDLVLEESSGASLQRWEGEIADV